MTQNYSPEEFFGLSDGYANAALLGELVTIDPALTINTVYGTEVLYSYSLDGGLTNLPYEGGPIIFTADKSEITIILYYWF